MSEEISGFLSHAQKQNLQIVTGSMKICEAQALIDKYRQSINTTGSPKPVLLQTELNEPVEGFYFELTKELSELLTFGFAGIYLAIGEYPQGGLTTIIYAVDNAGRTVEVNGKIFDYSEPCPDKCVKSVVICPPVEID